MGARIADVPQPKPIEIVVAPSCEKPVGGIAPDVLCVCDVQPDRVNTVRPAVAEALQALYDWLDEETALSYVLVLRTKRVRCPVLKVTIHHGEGEKLLPLVLARIPGAVVRPPRQSGATRRSKGRLKGHPKGHRR